MSSRGGVSRRGFGKAVAAGAAGVALGHPAGAEGVAVDPVLRDAALRGLALSVHRGDPVSARMADAAIARLEALDREGWLLARLYRVLDVRPAGDYWRTNAEADPDVLAGLHDAVQRAVPVSFRYLDRDGQETAREVYPLALVHPPQGVKLLAWCTLRQDFRQFFVREMRGMIAGGETFESSRLALLQALVEKERA